MYDSPSLGWRAPPNPIPNDLITRTLEADVVIIGAGHSGTAAARAAVEENASVIVLEKQDEASFFTYGLDFGHINSEFLRRHGIPRADELEFLNNWQLRSGNRSNAKLVRKFIKNCGACFDWFTEPMERDMLDDIKIRFWPPNRFAEKDINGIKSWVGTATFIGKYKLDDAVAVNRQAAQTLGARFLFKTPARRLEKDGNRVTGVIAQEGEDGGYIRINAKNGIILAAGDFSGNGEMMMELCDEIADLADEGQVITSMFGRDGSGIRMGVWAGGRLAPAPRAVMGGNTSMPKDFTGGTPTLWLDDNCERYCNEGFGDGAFSGLEGCRQPSGTVLYGVFDSKIENLMQAQPPVHGACWINNDDVRGNLRDRMRETVRAGEQGYKRRGACTYAAQTLDKLADYLGLEGKKREGFLNSITRYNSFCVSGRDEDFGKTPSLLFSIDSPPFFCVKYKPFPGDMLLVTVDGLWTDERQNVLGMDKRPIAGLYATGNCCGRRWGIQYSTPVSGVSIGMAWTLGREAGREVAGR